MALSSAFGLIGCLQGPMTPISFRSFQLRMETGERVMRIIQTRIIQGDRFTDPSVLMFSVADNNYVASSDVAVSLKKSANIHPPVWDSCAIPPCFSLCRRSEIG
jgi:hypothetical protein